MEALDPALIEQLKQVLFTALQEQQPFEIKWLPSIVGILSTLAAFLVGILSYRAAQTQITSAQNIAKEELANAREIAISQIKANLVAASRKEWIENLRKNIAELFSLANKAHSDMHSSGARSAEDGNRMWQISAYIELLLNPAEQEHLDFRRKQLNFVTYCISGDKDVSKWGDLKEAYISSAKAILKSEWNKVKAFE